MSLPVASPSVPSAASSAASSAAPSVTAPHAPPAAATSWLRPLLAPLAGWLLAALALGASGAVAHAPPLIPVAIVGAVAAWVIAYRRAPAWRARIDAVPLGALVGLHVARAAIGAWFLVELSAGRLPAAFAVKAGWGDLAVGAVALPLALVAPAPRARRALAVWNLLGLIDIAMAAGTAQYLFLARHDPLIRAAIPHLPYALLPGLVVPLVIVSHLAIAARLRHTASA